MLLDMVADSYGDRVALAGTRHRITYSELRTSARGGADIITRSGAQSVALVGVNSEVVPLLLFAAAKAGVPLTPLNYRLSQEQLAEQIGRLPEPLLVVDPEYVEIVRRSVPAVYSSADWFETTSGLNVDSEGLTSDEDQPAVVLFTSGTTSTPKGVVLAHDNLVSYVFQTVEFASADEDSSALISVPPYHIAGIGTALTNVYSGRRMVYLPNFSARAWLDLVRSERVSNAMVVPTMLARIVEELDGAPADTPHLNSLAYGGARMPRPVLERALTVFPATGFVNAYGLTETSSTIAVLGPDDHRAAMAGDQVALDRLSSVGQMVPGMEGVVRDAAGRPLEAGVTGELWVRGPQVSGEYVGLGSVLDEDGWFPTRDRAFFDTDGYLFIEGRSDDTIIRGGENIAPAEIETVLLEHPSIRDAAVFGSPDDEWGERIIAAIVLTDIRPGPDAESVRAYVRERLRGSRTPDDIVFRDELPYTQTGKLLRNELRRKEIESSLG
jgi:acyl-CoA synthetase (AMP-forming)/AMP-acid ligase II